MSLVVDIIKPNIVWEAISQPHWKNFMDVEYDSLIKKKSNMGTCQSISKKETHRLQMGFQNKIQGKWIHQQI